MNLEKGLKRLTIVLSLLAGPFCFFYQLGRLTSELLRYEFLIIVLAYEVVGFVAVWIIYWSAFWVIKGFRDDTPKNEQNNN
jgi:hypothetical protein